MNQIESELFDEFKRVDAMCRDMLNSDKGVGTYIELMEMSPMSTRYRIANWDNDYKQLKHIRWVRNQLAHETGYVECTADDVEWLKDFHQRLLKCEDPLAKAEQLNRHTQVQKVSVPKTTIAPASMINSNSPKRKSKLASITLAVLCAAAAVSLIVLLFWLLNK